MYDFIASTWLAFYRVCTRLLCYSDGSSRDALRHRTGGQLDPGQDFVAAISADPHPVTFKALSGSADAESQVFYEGSQHAHSVLRFQSDGFGVHLSRL